MYNTEVLSEKYFKIFMGAYNDFRVNCKKSYHFELEPLTYEQFLKAYEKGLVDCIVLLEEAIPTAFLCYSRVQIEGSIDIFVIHCLGNENHNEKKRSLIEAFLKQTEELRKDLLVAYPMLGTQGDFKDIISEYDFKFINLAVMDFPITDKKEIRNLEKMQTKDLPIGYKVVSYREIFKEELKETIYEAFKDSTDRFYDPRFGNLKGMDDVVYKLTEGIYGNFLASESKILLFENKIVGFCFANIMCRKIGNISLVGVLPEHRGLGLSEILLKMTIEDIVKSNKQGSIEVDELNVSVDLDNEPALKMYKKIGFTVTHTYPQGYLPSSSQK